MSAPAAGPITTRATLWRCSVTWSGEVMFTVVSDVMLYVPRNSPGPGGGGGGAAGPSSVRGPTPAGTAAGRDDKLQRLAALAGPHPPPAGEGPMHCGPVADLRRADALARLCAAYAAAFSAGRPVYPYLTDGQA